MREIAIVAGRELKSFFASPIAYVFGSLFLLFQSYFSVQATLVHGNPTSMQGFFGLLPVVFLLFLPALTMRTWAEERKLGTLELLMTFPITIGQTVLGKFFAALVFLGLVLALTLVLPVTLAAFGTLDWGPVLAAYVAALLMAGAYISVGMFCSSLTRDQIVAFLIALVLLAFLYVLGHPYAQLLMGSWMPEFLVGMIGGASPYQYFTSIARGVLDSRDFIYYLCFCGFFLALNAMVLLYRRHKG